MQFDYARLEKRLGMENYNPDIDSVLMGIAQEYDRRVANNNKKIFTGKLNRGETTIRFTKGMKERLRAQRFATNSKIKIIEEFKDLYSSTEIISAINGFKP